MNILSTVVADPRRRGEYKNPVLTVEIDEELRETGEPRMHNEDTWRVIPHGPYFAVDTRDPATGEWENGNLGVFNTLGLHREPLVECDVITPTEHIEVALGLERARRLIKRAYDSQWSYIMDDIAGQHGEVTWRLQHNPLKCVMCGKIAYGEAFYAQTYLPYCNEHMVRHNARVRNIRESANS